MSSEATAKQQLGESASLFLQALFEHVPPGVIEVRILEDRRKGKLLGRGWYTTAMQLLHEASGKADQFGTTESGVFYGVLPRKIEGKGKGEDTLPGFAAWADLDFCDFKDGENECRLGLARFPLPPTAVVSSGHGLHAYWFMKEPEVPDALVRLSAGLADVLGGDHVADAARILRLPGTMNRKDPDHPVPVLIEEQDLGRRYNPCDFEEFLGSLPQPSGNGRESASGGASPGIGLKLSARVQELITRDSRIRNLFEGKGKPGRDLDGKRLDTTASGYDYSFVLQLARKGVRNESELATALSHRPDGAAREKGKRYIFRTVRSVLKKLTAAKPARVGDYRVTDEGIKWDRPTKDGVVATPLTNFTATITSQIARDDGLERRLAFEIEATLHGRRSVFSVPAERFSGMNWVTEHLGAAAIVYPGQSIKDHTRAAIQFHSGEPPFREVYLHTGWREIDGHWCYLHADGGIGPKGPVDGIEVQLPDALQNFRLPEPPQGEELQRAVRASLGLLDIAPERVMAPTLAATYRSVLGPCDFSLHQTGPTGVGKTEVAALVQQNFGPEFDARHLPASWSSTANSLEGLAFYAKDAVLVVDDFAPGGSANEVARLHQQADRYFRAQGNRSGRGRMTSDGRLRLARPPRGLTISTGEDVPRGQSLRARLLITELGPKELNTDRLTRCQGDARAGFYAQAMSGFIQWLAPHCADLQNSLTETIQAMRIRLEERSHLRTASIEANLLLGAELFLSFAQEVGAIDGSTRGALWGRFRQGIAEAAQAQQEQQRASEPTHRFLELLRSAITSGEAHFVTVLGEPPDDANAWGWRERRTGTGLNQRDDWQPMGLRVGWLDDESVYLDLNAAHRVAQRAAGTGEGISVGVKTLARRLSEKELLITDADDPAHLTVRRTVEGKRRRVHQLHSDVILPEGEE